MSLCNIPTLVPPIPAIPIPIPMVLAAAIAAATTAMNDVIAALPFPIYCPLD